MQERPASTTQMEREETHISVSIMVATQRATTLREQPHQASLEAQAPTSEEAIIVQANDSTTKWMEVEEMATSTSRTEASPPSMAEWMIGMPLSLPFVAIKPTSKCSSAPFTRPLPSSKRWAPRKISSLKVKSASDHQRSEMVLGSLGTIRWCNRTDCPFQSTMHRDNRLTQMAKVGPSLDRPVKSVLEAAVREPLHSREWDGLQAWMRPWLNSWSRSRRIAIEKPKRIWRPCQCSTRGTTRFQHWRNLTWIRSFNSKFSRETMTRWTMDCQILLRAPAETESFANLFRTSLMWNCLPKIWAVDMAILHTKWSQESQSRHCQALEFREAWRKTWTIVSTMA